MRHLTKNEDMMKEHELKTDPQVFDAEDEAASMSTGELI